ncbi:MAG: ATP-binding protein [Acidobacteriota bacterium]
MRIKEKIKTLIKKDYFKEYGKDPYQEVIKAVTYVVDYEILKKTLLAKLQEFIPVETVLFYLLNPEKDLYEPIIATGYKLRATGSGPQAINLELNEDEIKFYKFSKDDRLIKWLRINKKELNLRKNPNIFDYLALKEREILGIFNVELSLPLISLNKLIGMVFLGTKKDSSPYSSEEIRFLRFFSYQASLAFENALLLKEKKESFIKMVRADRLATIGQLASGAAHEIKNPLTTIKSTLQYIKKYYGEENSKKELIEKILDETDRIDSIVKSLLSFSKIEEPHMEDISLVPLIESCIQLIDKSQNKNLRIKRNYMNEPKIKGDSSQLKQVLFNVFLNAMEAMPDGGEIEVTVETVNRKDKLRGEEVLIRIKDSGIGITEENLEKIFDPFFTTKEEGTGLGLSISYGIIKKHGGEIDVKSETGEGTEVILKLPV